MTIDGRRDGARILVTVAGRMDAGSAPEFDKRCEAWLAEGALSFVVDFSGLDYISSAGLRSLLVLGKKAASRQGRVVIAAAKDVVKEVFTISGFGAIFPMVETVEAALGRL
jgi:anti-anti-sigma factor